jgi:hypothetical protein
MSAIPCSKVGCNNVMCDRYSYVYGYICRSCFVRLVGSKVDIQTFMNTPKEEEEAFNYTKDRLSDISGIFQSTDY